MSRAGVCPLSWGSAAPAIPPCWSRIRQERKRCYSGKPLAVCASRSRLPGTGWSGDRRDQDATQKNKEAGYKIMANDLAGKKVAFLGAGKMGGIVLQALLKNGMLSPKSTCATVAHAERAKALASKLKVKVGTNNSEAVRSADVIVI